METVSESKIKGLQSQIRKESLVKNLNNLVQPKIDAENKELKRSETKELIVDEFESLIEPLKKKITQVEMGNKNLELEATKINDLEERIYTKLDSMIQEKYESISKTIVTEKIELTSEKSTNKRRKSVKHEPSQMTNLLHVKHGSQKSQTVASVSDIDFE